MDAYLKLTPAESVVYNRELHAVEPEEREVVMQLTNEWIEQGKVEGRQEGRQDLVLRQLLRRLGPVARGLENQVRRLSDGQVDQLGEALFDFQTLSDAEQWFRRVSQ